MSYFKYVFCAAILSCIFSCSSREQEIPIAEIPDDLIVLANQNAHLILNLCDDDEALRTFKKRSSTKMKMQDVTGKQFLLCLVYKSDVSNIEFGELHKVVRLKGNVKRFKYKLRVESDTYNDVFLFLDLNAKKFIANYAFYGKNEEGTWDSLLDKKEVIVKKSLKEIR